MKARTLYLLAFYLFTVLVLTLGKPVFMWCNGEGHAFAAADVLRVMGHGLKLDLSTALYLLTVPFLAVLVSIWLHRWKPVRTFLKMWNALVAMALSLALVADASLYSFWGFKLDYSVFQYIDTTGDAFASVSAGYLAWRLVAVAGLAFLLYKAYTWLTPCEHSRRRGVKCVEPLRRRLLSTAAMLVAMPLMVIGIRGGVSVSTTNVGQVYFSQDHFLNHAAVNPLFSFLASFGKSAADVPDYRFLGDDECREVLSHAFFTEGQPADTLLRTPRPDIVLVVMESCGGQFTEISGRSDITPNLNRLAYEGIYFTQCYANSWRTDRGLVSILSGWPALPKTSIMKMPSKVRTMPSLARSLGRAGYTSTFVYGGDIDFTNTRGYLLDTGTAAIVSEDDFTLVERGTSKWGVCDSITFSRLLQIVTQPTAEDGAPRFTTLLTLSSHEPWTVPMPRHFDDEILNAFYYLDRCIGQFVSELRKTPQWDNTLLILLPDHGIKYQDIDETKALRSHIPMIWTGGAVKSPRTVERLCTQSDLAATLLGQMGLPHGDFTFSRDIFSTNYARPFALHTHADGFAIITPAGFSTYDLQSQQAVTSIASDIDLGKAVIQTVARDLKQR